ncbi:MAG: helix-turn-helix transcriptional regulator [Lachnospiraceae bacterium]|nr:helix-turn-helix transcriptional regulator [Lachnospiraceae bacterium]
MCRLPSINMTETGRNIMRLRQDAGLTVKDLQEIFGFGTPQAVYKWQHGSAIPTVDNLVVLSAIFGVPIDQILVIEREELIEEQEFMSA